MSEQVKKPDWVPEGLPEGWKVEIRVRKNGKKDRYYTDPVHGYIFRSIADIDRYLLTGQLGRHVTKTKPKDSSSSTVEAEAIIQCDNVPHKKELIKSDGMKMSCLGLAAQGQYLGEKTSKRRASGRADDSKEMTRKRSSRGTSTGKASRSPKKRDSTPFYIIDPDQCEENSDIPNLSEIIDSIRREEDRKTVYISAPAIGSLLGGQISETRPKQDHYNTKPRFAFNISQHFSINPNMPYVPSNFLPKEQAWNFQPKNNIFCSYQQASPVPKFSKLGTESQVKGEPRCADTFGNVMTDPCIDFAVKTLAGTNPFAREMTMEDCFLQSQFGTSRVPQ